MKKPLSLLLSLCLAVCLAACGETPQPTETDAPTEPSTKTVYVHTSITQTYGATVNRTEFVFDESDRVTDVVIYSDDKEVGRYSVECDENGNYHTWTSTVGETESVMEYSYDDRGHLLGTTMYMNGELLSATEYTWSGENRTGIISRSPNPGTENRNEFTYDEAGRMIRQDLYVNGELSSYAVCSTDDQGRLTLTAGYLPDGTAGISTAYTYEDSTETRVSTNPDGTVSQKMVLTYDNQGNLLSSVTYDSEGNVTASETHTWKAIEVPLDCPRASV